MRLFGLTVAVLLAVICYEPLPASAQGVYVGPGGVGIDIGPQRRDYRDRDYERPRVYEERSRVYRERRSCRTYYVQRSWGNERITECD